MGRRVLLSFTKYDTFGPGYQAVKGNRSWFHIAGIVISECSLRQIRSKGNEKPFDVEDIRYIPCSIQSSSTVDD